MAEREAGGAGAPAPFDYEALWGERWGDLQRYGPVSRHQRTILRTLLEPLAFETALDVGCGEGSNLAFLAALRPLRRVVGVDVAAAALARARALVPGAELVQGDARAAAALGPFDLVTSIDVVEHVEDDVAMLRAMAEATRRWVLCVTVQGRMRRGEEAIGHVRNYRRGELVEKLRSVGLRPVRVVEWGFPFYSPLFRSAVATSGAESLSYGRYGPGKRLLCHAIHALFRANSWRRGDKLFVLAERAPAP